MKKLKFLLNFGVQFVRRFWRTLLLILIVFFTTLLLSAAVSIWLNRFHNLSFPSLGTIRVISVEAYGGDISILHDGKKFIDWGTVYPGTLTNRSFYIKSISNEPIILQLIVSNVTFKDSMDNNVTATPPLKNPLHLTWNYTNAPINPNEEIYVTLTLEISSETKFVEYVIDNDVKGFYLDITIKPVEH